MNMNDRKFTENLIFMASNDANLTIGVVSFSTG